MLIVNHNEAAIIFFWILFAPCKEIEGSLRKWTPAAGLKSLSVELGFWIPIDSGYWIFLSCILDSTGKILADSGFCKEF